MPATTSPLNLVPTAPTRRPQRLKCRFVIWDGPCHRRVSDLAPLCRHLEQAAYEAGCRFLEDMERQGWESTDGRLKITGGPFPATEVGASDLVRPNRPHRGLGPHPRFGPEVSYESPVLLAPTIDTTDTWEYELSGWFVRPLPPLELPVSVLERMQSKRVAQGRARGR